MKKTEFNKALNLFKEKDYSCFEKFYELVGKTMYITAYKYLHNKPDAEDVMSEVIIKMLKYTVDEVDNPTGWIIEITKNAALKFLEKREKEVFCEFDEAVASDSYFNLLLEDLNRFLTEKEYETILYVACYGFTLKEAASMMGVSKRQTQRYYTEAKIKVNKYLKETNKRE